MLSYWVSSCYHLIPIEKQVLFQDFFAPAYFFCVSTNMYSSVCIVIEVSKAIGRSVVFLPLN